MRVGRFGCRGDRWLASQSGVSDTRNLFVLWLWFEACLRCSSSFEFPICGEGVNLIGWWILV